MKSYTHFTLSERESLSEKLKEGKSYRQIAKEMGRSPSTISREVKRNYSKKKDRYHPWRATVLYITRRKHCKRKYKIDASPELLEYLINALNQYWTPEEIAARSIQNGTPISCSTIYRMIKLKKLPDISEKTHLRRHGSRKYQHGSNSNTIKPEHLISERPEICELKARFGDFEGDTVCGAKGKGCIVTLVDRKSKLLLSALSPDMKASSVRTAIQNAFRLMQINIPIETITFDRGAEFADFKEIEKDLGTTIYFADPHSPWQRGLNENTNDIIRFFFPKGCDFRKVSDEELQTVVSLINNRPRKTLGYLSPLEFLSAKCCT